MLNRFTPRYLELRNLIVVIGLMTGAMVLTQAGLDYQVGQTFSWANAEWAGVIFWYSVSLIVFSLLLGVFRPRTDPFILPLVGLLGGLGLALMYRLPTPWWDAEAEQAVFITRNMWYVRRQAWMLIAGQGLMLAALFWPGLLRWLRDHPWLSIMTGLGLLLATAILGEPVVPGGPRVSLNVGITQFQPAELIKLLFVVYLAAYLHRVRPDFNRFTYRYLGLPLPVTNYLAPMMLVLGSAILFLVLMSDLGAALILIGVFPVMVFLALRRRVFLSLLSIFAVTLLLLYFGLAQIENHAQTDLATLLREPEQISILPGKVVGNINKVMARVNNWQEPWAACTDDNGCPSYQTLESLYAVSAGGLWGAGPGLGQLEYIPAVFTDLVFAAWTEEWGLLGAVALLFVYGYLLKRGGTIAKRQPEPFNSLLAMGIVTIFAMQIFVIIGGTLNVIPLTGITVPFLSYGGTSILTSSLMMGLLLRLSAEPGRINATHNTRQNISRVMSVVSAGLLMLGLALAYWTLWMGPKLHPSFPERNDRSDNLVAWQRQSAWLEHVVRGRIFAADGTLIAGSGETSRLNYYPSLIHTVGQADDRGLGLSGLEYTFNDVLLGKGRYDLKTLWARQWQGAWQGNDLQLTIDLDWQRAAHDGLGGFDGAVVALDAESGAVLAMVSHPLYDPTATDTDSTDTAQLNRAVAGLYPPGSTFKTVIGALALEQSLAQPESSFDFSGDVWYWDAGRLCHMQWIGGGEISSCNSDLQQMTLTEGLAWSDNILFAQLANQLGPQRVTGGSAGFGFGQTIPFDLPVMPSSVAGEPDWLNDPAQLAMTGFGQSQVLATPLQMGLVAAAITNDGQVPQPYLVAETLRPDGKVLQETRPQTWQRAVSKHTARSMKEMLVESVATGWANTAAVDGLVVGGKTGTAEWQDGQPPHSWFIGFAEMPNGRTVAIAVIAEAAGEGSQQAAPIAGYIFSRMNRTLLVSK